MKSNDKKKPVWFIGINLNGMWRKTPYRGYWDEELQRWCDSSGSFDAKKIGLYSSKNSYCITFASHDKKDVEIFMQGAKALATLVQNVAWVSLN